MFKLRFGFWSLSAELPEFRSLTPMLMRETRMTMMITPVAVMKEIKTGGDTHDSVLGRENEQCSKMIFQVQYFVGFILHKKSHGKT